MAWAAVVVLTRVDRRPLWRGLAATAPDPRFANEASIALMITLASWLGIPVSTTHDISAAIMGVGTAKRSAIECTVVEKMIWGWIPTISRRRHCLPAVRSAARDGLGLIVDPPR